MTQNQTSAKASRRHRRYWRLLRRLTKPYATRALGFTADIAPALDVPVLVLANHNTDADPLLVAQSFERHMYFVASEHIFRWGWITRIINYLLAPIPIIKGRSDTYAAMSILRMLRKGQSICIFAEGNRSVDGRTAPISPATGLLAKAGADLITYRLEGGYFTQPRWSHSIRRGRMRGHVVAHYPAHQLKEMTTEEINSAIARDLFEDAYARQCTEPAAYRGKRLAEHLETALYLCPRCMAVGQLHSQDDILTCRCGLRARYTEAGRLQGDHLPFDSVADWYAWQLTQTDRLIDSAADSVIFTDAGQALFLVDPCVRATPLAQGTLSLTADALSLAGHTFPLRDIAAMSIVGQMTITFSTTDGTHYEIKSDHPRSGYAYLNAFETLRARASDAQ